MTNETVPCVDDPFAAIKEDLSALRDDSIQAGLSIMSDFEVAGQFVDRGLNGGTNYVQVPQFVLDMEEEEKLDWLNGHTAITLFKFTGAE